MLKKITSDFIFHLSIYKIFMDLKYGFLNMLWNTKFLNNFFLYVEPFIMILNLKKNEIATIITSALYMSFINYSYKYITKCTIAYYSFYGFAKYENKI